MRSNACTFVLVCGIGNLQPLLPDLDAPDAWHDLNTLIKAVSEGITRHRHPVAVPGARVMPGEMAPSCHHHWWAMCETWIDGWIYAV
jgi:hypothetical protein